MLPRIEILIDPFSIPLSKLECPYYNNLENLIYNYMYIWRI